tara:strand:+ start:123 stop:629 length:507 start_codon:yes stop_codon:yes gene_type:complete
MEIWKEIKGFEDYEASNLGRVKSLARTIYKTNGTTQTYKEKILKPGINDKGYLVLSLRRSGKAKTKKVHQLVAIAFLNHIPCGHKLVVDHIDNNPLNNKLGNLQIITTRKNCSKDKRGGYSKYTGVTWDKCSKKWTARILINGKRKHLGSFKDETKAAEAYQIALNNL